MKKLKSNIREVGEKTYKANRVEFTPSFGTLLLDAETLLQRGFPKSAKLADSSFYQESVIRWWIEKNPPFKGYPKISDEEIEELVRKYPNIFLTDNPQEFYKEVCKAVDLD